MDLIASCAVAVAPDAVSEIKAVLAKLNPRALAKKGNDPAAASAKDGKTVIVGEKVKNPLDGPILFQDFPRFTRLSYPQSARRVVRTSPWLSK